MASPRNAAPTPNIAPFIAFAAIIIALLATWLRLPGAVAAWAVLLVAAWMSTGPQLTGKKDLAGYPTVGNPGEGRKLREHQKWTELRWKLIASTDWLPNSPHALARALQRSGGSALAKSKAVALWLLVPQPLVTWAALGAAMVAFTLPVDQLALIGAAPATAGWLMWPNAIAAYVIFRQLDASARRFAAPADPQPAVEISTAVAAAKRKGLPALAVPVAAAIAAVVTFGVLTVVLNGFDLTWLVAPWQLAAAGAGITVAAVVVRQVAMPDALEDWRKTVAARELWDVRWQMLKVDPAPHLTEHREVEMAGQLQVLVDTFDAPGSLGAEGVVNLTAKMGPAVGGGSHVIVVNEPDLDSQGQPVPGSKSPIRFSVVVWPTDSTFTVLDPDADTEALELLLRAAAARNITTEVRLPQPLLTGLTRISGEGAAAWKSAWSVDADPAMLLGYAAAQIGHLFGVDAVADVRAGEIYFGAIYDEDTDFADAEIPTRLVQLGRESAWSLRWKNVLKQGEQRPHIQHAVYGERELPGGLRLLTQPFMVSQGINSEDYMNSVKEKALSSTLDNAPFVSVQRWDGSSDRGGERHLGAFRVVWSPTPVSLSPADVPPATGRAKDASLWILGASINAGFDLAKLPRPEIMSATVMTARGEKDQIWDIRLRLYGDVNLAKVKQAADKIRNGMGAVPWLRVSAAQDGIRVVAGARPTEVKFARPTYRDMCTALDWEEAFTVAKVITPTGLVPTMVSAETLPKNEKVQRLVFKMPPGLDRPAVRNAKKTLMPATGNIYVEDEAGPTPDTVALIVCPEQPVPFPAPYDWDAVAESRAVPFAAGVTGEPIAFDWKLDPHLLVLGGTGSGKSATLQNLITGALIRGCDMYIADPTKAAADFQYARPWAKAIAVTDGETSAMMDHVYAEVTRRKIVNAAHGVASYTDLPDDVRPPHIVVVIDEFTSLMFTERLAKLPDNASEDEQRQHAEHELSNTNRRRIGSRSGQIVREARSAGVTLVLAAQELKADTLASIPGGGSIKNNSSSILLGKATTGSRMSALKDPFSAPELGDDVPKGRGLFESSASSAQVIQSWFDAPDHVRSLTEHIAAVRQPIADDERLDFTTIVKSVVDAPVFGRRKDAIDVGDLEEGDDVEVDLGLVDIDLSDLFNDDDEEAAAGDDEMPAPPAIRPLPTPVPATVDLAAPVPQDPARTVILAGPGCPEDAMPSGSIDVDEFPPGEPVTGLTVVDAIASWVRGQSDVARVEWVSPAALEVVGDETVAEVLERTLAPFGVAEVLASLPAAPSRARRALPTPSGPAMQTQPPAPAASLLVPAAPVSPRAPRPVAAHVQVTLPPPPPAGVPERFDAPRRIVPEHERF